MASDGAGRGKPCGKPLAATTIVHLHAQLNQH